MRLSDPQGVDYIRATLGTPSRSGLMPLRLGGYDKSDLLAEVHTHRHSAKKHTA